MSVTRDMKTPFIHEEYDKFEKKRSRVYFPISSGFEVPHLALSVISHDEITSLPTYCERDTTAAFAMKEMLKTQGKGASLKGKEADDHIAWLRKNGPIKIAHTMTLRSSSINDSEFILVDFFLSTEDWFWLKDGSVIVNIDDKENITLTTDNSATNNDHKMCWESGCFQITKEQLKKIGDAKSIEIKVSGSGSYFLWNKEESNDFLNMVRCFYNNIIDTKSYLKPIKGILDNHKLDSIKGFSIEKDLKDKFIADEISLKEVKKLQKERNTAKKQEAAKQKGEREKKNAEERAEKEKKNAEERAEKEKKDAEERAEREKKDAAEQKKKEEEKQERIKERRLLIQKGKPEIDYDALFDMKKRQTLYIIIFLCSIGSFLILHWVIGIGGIGFSMFMYNKKIGPERLKEVFGQETCEKYNNSFQKLHDEYKDDVNN
jgi:hypothetical protein